MATRVTQTSECPIHGKFASQTESERSGRIFNHDCPKCEKQRNSDAILRQISEALDTASPEVRDELIAKIQQANQ